MRCVRCFSVLEVSSTDSLLASRLGHEGLAEVDFPADGVKKDESENMLEDRQGSPDTALSDVLINT